MYSSRRNRERWVSPYYGASRRNRERWVTPSDAFEKIRRNRERWVIIGKTKQPAFSVANLPTGASTSSTATSAILLAEGAAEQVEQPPVVDPGSEFTPQTTGSYTDANDKPPCPTYTYVDWPEPACPTVRTYEYMEAAWAQVVAEMNFYRTARGMQPLTWDAQLSAGGQIMASYIEDYPLDYATGGAHQSPNYTLGFSFVDRYDNGGEQTGGYKAEGISYAATTPMDLLCNFQDEWQSDTNAGHFGPMVNTSSVAVQSYAYVGFGWKNNTAVVMYSSKEGINPVSLESIDPTLVCLPAVDKRIDPNLNT